MFDGFIMLLLFVMLFAGFMFEFIGGAIFDGDDIGVAVIAGITTAVLFAILFEARLALTLVDVPPQAIPRAVIAKSDPVAMILFIFVSLLSFSKIKYI